MKTFSQKVIKPWGYEILVTSSDSPVTGKIAFTKAGHRWSLQYHDLKDENITLIKGKAEFWLEDEIGVINKLKMNPLVGYRVKPLKKHRFCAITDCLTAEFSTAEEGKTVRLEDDYRRGDETEEKRKRRSGKGVYLG